MLLFQGAAQNPIYQTPLGQQKLRNLWQNVIDKYIKIDWQRFLQTEEEYAKEQQAMAEIRNAEQSKASTQETMAVTQSLNQTGE